MKHILGVVGSKAHNLGTGFEDYMIKQYVSQDIINWLEMHDVRIDAQNNKIYICNEVEYIYLGIQFTPPVHHVLGIVLTDN